MYVNINAILIFMFSGGLLLRYASQNSLDESSQKQIPGSGRRERAPYKNCSHTARVFEVLHSLRKYVMSFTIA